MLDVYLFLFFFFFPGSIKGDEGGVGWGWGGEKKLDSDLSADLL